MDRRAGDLAAPGNGRFVGAQAVHARPAKRWDERRVHVQDAARIGCNDAGAEHGQKARQHHKIDVVLFQRIQQCSVEVFTVFVVLAAYHAALHTGLCGAFQRIDAGLGSHHKGDLAIGVLAPGFAVQQGLQVGAAAGN